MYLLRYSSRIVRIVITLSAQLGRGQAPLQLLLPALRRRTVHNCWQASYSSNHMGNSIESSKRSNFLQKYFRLDFAQNSFELAVDNISRETCLVSQEVFKKKF
jgi:hypothetical protein